jgi:hypothetical protein
MRGLQIPYRANSPRGTDNTPSPDIYDTESLLKGRVEMTYKPLYKWDSPDAPDHKKVDQLQPYIREYLNVGKCSGDEVLNTDVGFTVSHRLAVYLALDKEVQEELEHLGKFNGQTLETLTPKIDHKLHVWEAYVDIEGNSWEKLTESLESMQKALDQFQEYDPDPYNPFVRGKNEIRTGIRGGVAIFAA